MESSETVIFIHGMFQNAQSWDNWVSLFSDRGFDCIANSWPLHEGQPSELREHPPAGLGDLRLGTVIDSYVKLIGDRDIKPIVIGHSVGGLVAQKLVELRLASSAVAICSVAPNRMMTLDWGFFKNSLSITNPIAGDTIFEMDAEGFHENFANTLSNEEAERAFERTATHDSRNVLRDCMLEHGEIDTSFARAPMLFLSAEKDQITPPELCEKNYKAYKTGETLPQYRMSPNRSHYICGEPGWEEVAMAACEWIEMSSAHRADAKLVGNL